jgi:hypothetical protein
MIANFYALLYRTYFALEKSATEGGLANRQSVSTTLLAPEHLRHNW